MLTPTQLEDTSLTSKVDVSAAIRPICPKNNAKIHMLVMAVIQVVANTPGCVKNMQICTATSCPNCGKCTYRSKIQYNNPNISSISTWLVAEGQNAAYCT